MKAKVIKAFKDKKTRSILRVGQEIEITEERFSELTAGPLGIFIEEVAEEIKEPGKFLTAEALEEDENPLPTIEYDDELTIKEAPARKKITKK